MCVCVFDFLSVFLFLRFIYCKSLNIHCMSRVTPLWKCTTSKWACSLHYNHVKHKVYTIHIRSCIKYLVQVTCLLFYGRPFTKKKCERFVSIEYSQSCIPLKLTWKPTPKANKTEMRQKHTHISTFFSNIYDICSFRLFWVHWILQTLFCCVFVVVFFAASPHKKEKLSG